MKDEKYSLLILFLALLSALIVVASKSLANIESRPVDVIQIDTGNQIDRSGVLWMETNCTHCWNIHGTQMATALEDELVRLRTRPVQGKQIVWKTEEEEVAAIYQAIDEFPKVISMSLAGDEFNEKEYLALKEASRRGILTVVASGNQGLPHPEYPGAYRLECLIAVSTLNVPGASKGDISLPRFPGENGTSFSTARAAGIALKYYQTHPKARCKDAKEWMLRKFGSTSLALK